MLEQEEAEELDAVTESVAETPEAEQAVESTIVSEPESVTRAIVDEPPVPMVEETTESGIELAASELHPSTLGRLGNDPRISPRELQADPVLTAGTPRMASPYPATDPRQIPTEHPSLLGRAANDPRSFDSEPETGDTAEVEPEVEGAAQG